MRILYVEDDPRDADLTVRMLRRSAPDLQLESVSTIKDALARLDRLTLEPLDLVLTDMHLPDGDGVLLLKHIRENSLPLAVVVVTGMGDPEYAQVGLTEAKARATHDIVVANINFDSTTRTIIDGRTDGFCKLIVERRTREILGCHVVGERAVEITQVAAVAIAGGMRVDSLARVPLSFPTYAGVLGRVAANATRQLNLNLPWQAT